VLNYFLCLRRKRHLLAPQEKLLRGKHVYYHYKNKIDLALHNARSPPSIIFNLRRKATKQDLQVATCGHTFFDFPFPGSEALVTSLRHGVRCVFPPFVLSLERRARISPGIISSHFQPYSIITASGVLTFVIYSNIFKVA
jgi:hypothetical protein